jgi:hypothetical protein
MQRCITEHKRETHLKREARRNSLSGCSNRYSWRGRFFLCIWDWIFCFIQPEVEYHVEFHMLDLAFDPFDKFESRKNSKLGGTITWYSLTTCHAGSGGSWDVGPLTERGT